jgi:hypothetical protein
MLTPETWDDFAALVEASNDVWGGCSCMGFHPEGVGAGHTRGGNREAKRRHVTRGTVHQVLVYDGDRCVGWCQFGSPPELPNINNRRTYDQGADEPPDWRIGCIFTNAKDRGKGAAAAWRLSAHRTGGVVCTLRLHVGTEDRQMAVGHAHHYLIPPLAAVLAR